MSGTQEASPEREQRVGVREFRDHMRKYLDLVAEGKELVLTERGVPIARVTPAHTKFWALVAQGHVRLATSRPPKGPLPRVPATGSVSDLIERNR